MDYTIGKTRNKLGSPVRQHFLHDGWFSYHGTLLPGHHGMGQHTYMTPITFVALLGRNHTCLHRRSYPHYGTILSVTDGIHIMSFALQLAATWTYTYISHPSHSERSLGRTIHACPDGHIVTRAPSIPWGRFWRNVISPPAYVESDTDVCGVEKHHTCRLMP
jgi:hypothetical protein